MNTFFLDNSIFPIKPEALIKLLSKLKLKQITNIYIYFGNIFPWTNKEIINKKHVLPEEYVAGIQKLITTQNISFIPVFRLKDCFEIIKSKYKNDFKICNIKNFSKIPGIKKQLGELFDDFASFFLDIESIIIDLDDFFCSNGEISSNTITNFFSIFESEINITFKLNQTYDLNYQIEKCIVPFKLKDNSWKISKERSF